MIGHPVIIQIGEDVIEETVAIEIHFRRAGPYRRRSVSGIQAVIHALFDGGATPFVPPRQ